MSKERRTVSLSLLVREWMTPVLLLSMAINVRAECFQQAADYYQVPEILLRAIARHESGMNPEALHVNANGSRDIGLMQINTRWLPELAHMGIREQDLWDPCTNIFVGAWVLANNLRRSKGDVWQAVGAYNAGWRESPVHDRRRADYAERIKRMVRKLLTSARKAAASGGAG
ncbi:MAG: hypothetical protein D6791_02850 [Chloroflexi bacterium]|nr:MAG: hypothetical protein D6791_02850 [Chloroflexota bacterium]